MGKASQEEIEKVAKVLRGMLAMHPLETAVELLRQVMPREVVAAARESIERQITSIRILRDPPTISAANLVSWYPGPSDEDRFWPALKAHLLKKKWGDEKIDAIDKASSKIVSSLHHPGLGKYQTRGLVAGDVQSGKTTNFTAVISKAADVGYRMFIVFSGVTNKLRRQTQIRLESELVELNGEHWITLTTSDADFALRSGQNANAFLTKYATQKTLVVVKKHSGRLENLRKWIAGAQDSVLATCPVLVVDDEADQASINTAAELAERSKVNGLIVEILKRIPKVAYVGYTATPYANFLINAEDVEDIYPRHFITSLPAPDNYFGYERIFGRERTRFDETDEAIDGLDMIRSVPGKEADLLRPGRGAVDGFDLKISSVPSLRDALEYFVMATAARLSRGHASEHSTMLVHTTQTTAIHRRFKEPVEKFYKQLALLIAKMDDKTLARLKKAWNEEQEKVPSGSLGLKAVPFEAMLKHLPQVLKLLKVIVENYMTAPEERLVYGEDPGIFVVIGGDVLSRGLTLDGLVTSFFLRSATAYDTLMQMGRWFGYRDDYQDLPRVWMTDELRGYFYELGGIDKEVRQFIERSYNGQITPEQFAPMIRSHPSLMVTSRLKMQKAERRYLSYGDRNVQTILFNHRDKDWLQKNIDACTKLIVNLNTLGIKATSPRAGRWLFSGVKPAEIVAFLGAYSFHSESWNLNRQALIDYVNSEIAEGGLTSWNVLIVSQDRGKTKTGSIELGLGKPIPLITRSRINAPDVAYANIKSLMSVEDGLTDLGVAVNSESGWEEVKNLRNAKAPSTGLLVLYPIDRNSTPANQDSTTRTNLNAVIDVMGVGLVFPASKKQDPGRAYITQDLSHLHRELPDALSED